jgi:hypothetical protein
MPATVTFLDAFVRLETDDDVTFAEWRAAAEGILANPRYRRGMGVLHDWRRRTRALDAAEIEARSSHLVGSRFAPMRWALLVERAVDFGMGRMAEALLDASAIELRVFQDPVEAEAWVRRPEERG